MLFQVFLVHVYKCKMDFRRTLIHAVIFPLLSDMRVWEVTVSQGPRALIKARCFLRIHISTAWGGSLWNRAAHYPVWLDTTLTQKPNKWHILLVSSAVITFPPTWWEEMNRLQVLCLHTPSDKFTKYYVLFFWHSELQLIKGWPLTLMCLQWNTCNYLVCEALQVVILKEPFDHRKSLIG